jgi:hypothetical protein
MGIPSSPPNRLSHVDCRESLLDKSVVHAYDPADLQAQFIGTAAVEHIHEERRPLVTDKSAEDQDRSVSPRGEESEMPPHGIRETETLTLGTHVKDGHHSPLHPGGNHIVVFGSYVQWWY